MSVRIQAADLREAARKAEAVRGELTARGEDPTVYLDVEVVIDRNAAVAFRSDADPGSGSVRYVGTPRGLAGLIADVQTLGIADGVCLVTADEDRVVTLMLDELAPGIGRGRVSLTARPSVRFFRERVCLRPDTPCSVSVSTRSRRPIRRSPTGSPT